MNRVALIGIMIENNDVSDEINSIFHEYSNYIIGRMGLPKVRDGLSVISVVLDAPSDVINALSGKLGKIEGVTSKSIYSKAEEVWQLTQNMNL